MEQQNKRKKSEEVLAEIYRNANLAMDSINDILPQVDRNEMKEELLFQHEGYAKMAAQASKLAKDRGVQLKEPGMMKKAMMWSSIKMSSMMDGSTSHIAEMMVRGTVMGITALRSSQTEMPPETDKEVEDLLTEFIALEEDYEKRLKEYL